MVDDDTLSSPVNLREALSAKYLQWVNNRGRERKPLIKEGLREM